MLLPKHVKLFLIAFIVFSTALIVTINFSDLCRLETVTVNAQPLENWSEKYALVDNSPIHKLPLDSLAATLLEKNHIYKVDISYSLFSAIDIKTNNYTPVCFVLDKPSGQLFGINDESRVVTLENCQYNWDNPVLTSLSISKPFGFCSDYRVRTVINDLIQLQHENSDLYRLIDEIDFGNSGFLKVSIDGLSYRLKVRAEHLLTDIKKFIKFVTSYSPDMQKVKLLDLRYDEMIICLEEKN